MPSSQATGSANPSSTGSRHSAVTAKATAPRSTTGRASVACAAPLRLVAKRRRDWARRSRVSSKATTTSSSEASCDAATGSFMDSQAR